MGIYLLRLLLHTLFACFQLVASCVAESKLIQLGHFDYEMRLANQSKEIHRKRNFTDVGGFYCDECVMTWLGAKDSHSTYYVNAVKRGVNVHVRVSIKVVEHWHSTFKLPSAKLCVLYEHEEDVNIRQAECFSLHQHVINIFIPFPGTYALSACVVVNHQGQNAVILRTVKTKQVTVKTGEKANIRCNGNISNMLSYKRDRYNRPVRSKGMLFLPEATKQTVHVYIRVWGGRMRQKEYQFPPEEEKIAGAYLKSDFDLHFDRNWGTKEPYTVVILSLAENLKCLKLTNIRKNIYVHVLLNGFPNQECIKPSTCNDSDSTLEKTKRWIETVLVDVGGLATKQLEFVNLGDVSGNLASYSFMMNLIKADVENNKPSGGKNSDIVVVLEDDNLLSPTALIESIEMFVSHNPCYVYLNDSPLFYADLSSSWSYLSASIEIPQQTGLFVGRRRHWRCAPFITSTYIARRETISFFHDKFNLPNPKGAVGLSQTLLKKDSAYSCAFVSPIPGLGTLVENVDSLYMPETSLYYDWAKYIEKLRTISPEFSGRDFPHVKFYFDVKLRYPKNGETLRPVEKIYPVVTVTQLKESSIAQYFLCYTFGVRQEQVSNCDRLDGRGITLIPSILEEMYSFQVWVEDNQGQKVSRVENSDFYIKSLE
eukprot:g4648.t1